MKIFNRTFEFYRMSTEFGWWYILPSVEVKHKYWYLWQVLFSWGKWSVILEICREDWYNEEKRRNEL